MIDRTTETPTAAPARPALFNPNEHLMQIKSRNGAADYLPVQWRLVWFRSLCPNGSIETEIVHLDLDRETEEETFQWNSETRRSEKVVKRAPGFAVFRATVKDGRGGVAIGTKSEKAASFGDYIEKAETGSIGRALAALGYGTQFTGDEFDERHRIVDAPVDRAASAAAAEDDNSAPAVNVGVAATNNRASAAGQGEAKAGEGNQVDPNAPVTQEQLSTIGKLCKNLGNKQVVKPTNQGEAKALIAQLKQEYRTSPAIPS